MTGHPASTYRLQIRPTFTLQDAAGLVDYLADLGVGAIYLSPLLTATAGSDHGYDTTDVSRIDEARGGEEGWRQLREAADRAGLDLVVDIVPNHLGIAVPAENPAWWDTLRLGRESRFAHWFDIDWRTGPVIIPVLGDDAELRLEQGELRYFEHRFPIAPGTSEPGDSAEDVHARQHYRLVHHSRGDRDINFRRFFTVTTLAGVRVEDEEVFSATHALVRTWVGQGVAGLRVDHPDGLADPAEYLARLRTLAPDAWITVEKILESGEELPDWPVAGTTGYDAMREVDGLFVDPEAEGTFTDLYRRLTGDPRDFAGHALEGKRLAAGELLIAEGRRLAALAPDVADARAALVALAAHFDVYRSYLPDGVDLLDSALDDTRADHSDLVPALDLLAGRLRDPDDELARRFQQFTGAVMAKGVEDTAYYRYTRFVALNEVGGDPSRFGLSPADFHAAQLARLAHQPASMTAGSTHDTKRGEDVRARLAVLSEISAEWSRFVDHLGTGEDFHRFRSAHPGLADLSPAFDYLIKQTFAGVGLIDRERMHAYVEKAIREAKDGTSWTDPDAAIEAAAHAVVDRMYDDDLAGDELRRLLPLIEQPGWSNALGQKVIQLTMPGVPDVYQGTELWDDSLVDPDNRRPVDFDLRRRLLADATADPSDPPPVDSTGAAKLWITRQTLRLRRDHPEWFHGYRALSAAGPASDHLLAFDRGGAITVATRLSIRLAEAGGWRDTSLDLPHPVHDVLSGRSFPAGPVRVADLLDHYPVALLTPTP